MDWTFLEISLLRTKCVVRIVTWITPRWTKCQVKAPTCNCIVPTWNCSLLFLLENYKQMRNYVLQAHQPQQRGKTDLTQYILYGPWSWFCKVRARLNVTWYLTVIPEPCWNRVKRGRHQPASRWICIVRPTATYYGGTIKLRTLQPASSKLLINRSLLSRSSLKTTRGPLLIELIAVFRVSASKPLVCHSNSLASFSSQ